MRPLRIVVVLTALALAVAGCGGGEESSATTDTAVVTETTGDETTTDETTTEETTTDPDFTGLPSGDCLALVTAIASLGSAFAAPAGDNADTSEFFDRFDAPEEIKADFQILADAYAAYGAAIQDIGLDAGQTPSAEQLQQYQQALASIDQPGVAAASDRIGTWVSENCSSG
jgi:ABC-type glycerol-3-phosphate transport system substrate-binding protein